ncbi:hypothetical protein A4G19_03240 [Pasteurellaceae bacterium Macca]|nr:hypothetical protein [Pasteurellaceae bacterium Macca]
MPNRDYAVRSKAKKGANVPLILAIIVLLLAVSGLSLWLLMERGTVQTPPQTVKNEAKPALPSPPEEVYSYIRDLETREVPVDKNSKLAQLTKEQEQKIQQQREEEMRRLAQTQNEIDSPIKTNTAPSDTKTANVKAEKTKTDVKPLKNQETAKASTTKVKALTPEEFEAKKTQEQKEEEKRKKAAKEQAKKEPELTKNGNKYGLQCGAYKHKAQAENMQARLAMAGYNARISSNGEWNRVFIGPVGDRAAASKAQSNARSVAECLIIGM